MMGFGGWNIGGSKLDLLHTSLKHLQQDHDTGMSAVALQEVPRGEIGWSTAQAGKWEVLSYQNAVDWRGTGVAFLPDEWAVLRKIPSPHGCWVRLRKVGTRQDVWIGSIYVPPSYDTGDLQQAIQDHCDVLPATHLPTLLFGDVNAQLKWVRDEHGGHAYGEDSKARALMDVLQSAGFAPNAPRDDQMHQCTSRPRRAGALGRAIDWVATKHAICGPTHLLTDSCYLMGTDHDMLLLLMSFSHGTQQGTRIRTGKRVMKTKLTPVTHVDQPTLRHLARQHTGPPHTQGYRDPREVKQLLSHAKRTRLPQDWKQALRARRKAHQQWRQERVEAASQGDWRALKACRPTGHQGWETNLATHLGTDDPHHILHQHYASIFHQGHNMVPRSRAPASSADITLQEVKEAAAKVKLGKSVGHDEVSLELFREILQQDEGSRAIVTWFNGILHSGVIPQDWCKVVMVLLPKISLPKTARDTRPISMGCTAEKVFCHVILRRCKPQMHLQKAWQCSGEHRQSADYIFTMYKLLESEREWQHGLAVLKVDFARAFDSVRRDVLLSRIFTKLGDSEEYRIWENIMKDTSCTLITRWAQSDFPTDVGIRQGAIESPYFFGLLVEWIIDDVSQQNGWVGHVTSYPDLPLTQTAYMDDVLVWDGDCQGVERRYSLLREGFSAWGLQINPNKCSLYVSPKHQGPARVKLDGITLEAQPHIQVMGIPFRVGAGSGELLQPVWQRAKLKFWSIKHVLCASTPIGKRLKVLDRVVGGAAMWCISPFPPERNAMQALNLLLFQCILWMLRLKKPNHEHWTDFRKRGFRQARQLVVMHMTQRWSTRWLSQWWGYMGHLARNAQTNNPTCAAIMCQYRPLEWWQHQQALISGERHKGRFFAKIHPLDAKMNTAAGGPWREIAQDRGLWKSRAQTWISMNDLPWNSGMQFEIEW